MQNLLIREAVFAEAVSESMFVIASSLRSSQMLLRGGFCPSGLINYGLEDSGGIYKRRHQLNRERYT